MSQVKSVMQHVDLARDELIHLSLQRKEGKLSAKGVLTVETGKRTGRSPKARFLVCDTMTQQTVDWGEVNQPIEATVFSKLWLKTEQYLADRETFMAHLQVGADDEYGLPVKVINEYAWHNLFCQYLFMPRSATVQAQEWTLISAPGLELDPVDDQVGGDGVVILNLAEKKVLLCGMRYAGEMKKAMFTVLNYMLPEKDVLPMHCAANQGEKGDSVLFFGLSGTGKTTLSADPDRYLVGDDEHGWSSEGIFNFEGGCYAKCINLSVKNEPVIWEAISESAIMENVVLDDAGNPDFTDTRLTQNTRAAYPRSHIPKRVPSNSAQHPNSVLFLTCDLYGVLPPVAILNREQAAYYFLSGYTALVGSTEVGSAAGIHSTFSTCFGAPFFPRKPIEYAQLLLKRIQQTGAQVYLINTGWTGGSCGQGGERFSIPVTRSIVSTAISGGLLQAECEQYPGFNFMIPKSLPGLTNQDALNPSRLWTDSAAWKDVCNMLIEKFRTNFSRYDVSTDILQAAPVVIE